MKNIDCLDVYLFIDLRILPILSTDKHTLDHKNGILFVVNNQLLEFRTSEDVRGNSVNVEQSWKVIVFFFSQLLEYDKELSVFKDRLHELEISFPPRYDLLYITSYTAHTHLSTYSTTTTTSNIPFSG